MPYKRVTPTTLLSDDAEYVVMAKYKHELFVQEFVKHGPASYDDCAAYAERNESPDNNESYYVAEVTA